MKDQYNREINYLRVSITDRCNLRCIYCMPEEGIKQILSHQEILTYEEILRVINIAVTLGTSKVRITGGEPLVRKGVVGFIEKLAKIDGINDIGITTNGVLLKSYAKDLFEAGLKRLNISLDSLDEKKFSMITRFGHLKDVLEGIEKANEIGFTPIKINVVVMRGINDNEIEKFAQWSKEVPYQIRFIEFMPLGGLKLWSKELFVSSDEIKSRIQTTVGNLISVQVKKSGPAEYFMLQGAKGLLGFISPMTTHMCARCNRLRLTADGKLRACLFSDKEIDLKKHLRSASSDKEIRKILIKTIHSKPQAMSKYIKPLRPMSTIGG